ncbi:MAG: peptidase T [Ignavibacteria bacterium]|nr:peptidase T [Ignavibacteria bacterium]
MRKEVLERFLRYISVDTQSDENSPTTPSTSKQFDLAKMLVKELKEIGLKDAAVDENCYVMATLPANTDKKVPVIGFISHIDTSPDMSGANVKPQIIEDYQGGDILLNKENNIVLSPKVFPELEHHIGQTLITTDGTTLLGADDKAGIAEIMTAISYLVKHPEIKHGTIKVGFTPDEEIGRGVDKFDVKKFGADYAYTIDGGELGELEYENFNAAKATIKIQGRNVHPGYAKHKMQNAILMAMEFNAMLPVFDRPEFTQDYEGFYHLIKMEGTVENSMLVYIVRDHDRKIFEQRKILMEKTAEYMNHRYGKGTFDLELVDQYFNMREMVEPVKFVVDIAEEAMIQAGIEPKIMPIRGGTDGSRLSYMGLPCPNIFAGGINFHGKFEFTSVETMEKAAETIVKIAEIYGKRPVA